MIKTWENTSATQCKTIFKLYRDMPSRKISILLRSVQRKGNLNAL